MQINKLAYIPLFAAIFKSLTFKHLYGLISKCIVNHKEWLIKHLVMMYDRTGLSRMIQFIVVVYVYVKTCLTCMLIRCKEVSITDNHSVKVLTKIVRVVTCIAFNTLMIPIIFVFLTFKVIFAIAFRIALCWFIVGILSFVAICCYFAFSLCMEVMRKCDEVT